MALIIQEGDHGPVTSMLALKHVGSIMGVSSGRQGKSYGIVTIALEKGHIELGMSIRYDEHFLTPQQLKSNFK